MDLDVVVSSNQPVSSDQQQQPALPLGESFSTTSASEDTEESIDEDSQSDDEQQRSELEVKGKAMSSCHVNDTEDLLLHSLESDRYGPTVHKFISKYLDDGLDTFLLTSKATKMKKERGDKELSPLSHHLSGRTIKAATRHIDAQGKKAAFTRQHSQSMVNLHASDLTITPPSTPNFDHENNVGTSGLSFKSSSPSTTIGIRAIIESQYVTMEQESVSPNRQQDIRKKKRQVHRIRGQERDAKTADMESEASSNGTVSIELKSQFSCLPSRPIYQSSVRTSGNLSLNSSFKSSLSLQAPDCPLDRIQFFKHFSQLVRRGKRGGSNSFVGSNGNGASAGGFIELVYKQELRDLIWLEVKAWMNNKTMIDQDSHLCSQRQNIPQILQNLLKFSITAYRSRSNSAQTLIHSIAEESLTSPVHPASHLDSRKSSQDLTASVHTVPEVNDLRVLIDQDKLAASVAMKLTIGASEGGSSEDGPLPSSENSSSPFGEDDNCSCSETLSRLCQYCVDKDLEAEEQVHEMLQDIGDMEQLYPCTKALAYDYPAYSSEPSNSRMRSLYLFVNITRDMREKIDLLAKLFQITNREAAGWPRFSKEEKEDSLGSCDATPEIRQDVTGYSYKLSAQAPLTNSHTPVKQVHFKSVSSPLIGKDCNTSYNSDHTLSGPDSPEVQMNSPFENSLNSRGSPSQLSNSSLAKENLFFQQKPSIYRRYVDKALKHKGLRYIYRQISHILRPLLYRVHAALKKPSSFTYADAVSSTNCKLTVTSEHPTGSKKASPISREYCEELSASGVWSVEYQKMGLPTFHRPFLFLLRVTIDVVHDSLRLRLEQQPEQPSAVSVGQLIRECKEVLKAGVQIRQRYVNLAQTVLGEGGSDVIEAQLDTFDDDLKTMLQVYLRYLEQYMFFMQKVSTQASSTLRQKGYLEEEWNFMRVFCPHIPDGESLAANRFCHMASDLLTSIGEFIHNGIDECFAAFNESIAAAHQDQGVSGFRKGILQSCRKFKGVFQEAAARACQAQAFAKSLRKDLEFAAEFHMVVDLEMLLSKLKETGHIRVYAPNSLNHVMFVPNYMQGSEAQIWQLVDLTCWGKTFETDVDTCGYLLVMVCPDKEIHWTGTTVVLEPTAEATISLSHVQVDGILFVVNQPSHLLVQCQQFQQMMAGALRIHKQQTSCNHAIAESLTDLKEEALEIQNKTSHSLNLIYDQLDIDRVPNLEENERNSLQGRCLEVLHQGFKFGFEYEKALTRLITGDSRSQLAKQLITFALQWIKFVVTKCEKGRGLRTRWATQGLTYLMVALEPQYLQTLRDDEYLFLKNEVDKFFNHVTGSSERSHSIDISNLNIQGPYSVLGAAPIYKPLASSLNFQRSQSVGVKGMFSEQALSTLPEKPTENQISKGTRLEEWAQKKSGSRNSLHVSLRKIISKEENTLLNEYKPIERVQKAINGFEDRREQRLQGKGVIGSVSDLVIQRVPLHIAARKVTFPWQRGFKIGEGRFGKVYTAVNNSTGELIAMKEIHLQPNDHRAIKETLDEIRTFEGIKHPSLVRYYGVEIHREDLYIFMEYCNEGTLESAVQLNLPEQLVRKYTRELLDAVNVLHENGIVHRDIKSANIFLTSEGYLKLGDFGCCMKLKNMSTMAGELNAFVGTPAYMAPEIFTKNPVEGHGRAADIWSIGCVVLEMLSGRRPWYDLDNSYQIMFRVGMGDTPEVPEDICSEGKFFIGHCLIHDPRLRWSTGQLLCHPFTKVVDDDDLD